MCWFLKRTKRDRASQRWPAALIAVLMLLGSAPRRVSAQDESGVAEPPTVAIHVVQYGETLEQIAAAFGVTIEALEQANGFSQYDDVQVGQRLIIPLRTTTTSLWASSAVPVGLGDTLEAIAARYGLPAEQLAAVNLIVNPRSIYIGQTLRLPATARAGVGIVRLGRNESLWLIALRHNVSVVSLLLLNHLADPLTVVEGQILRLPAEVAPDAMLPAPWKALTLHPLPLEQGRVGGLHVETATPGTLKVFFLSREWPVISDHTTHEALLAVDRWTAPGLYPFTLTFTDNNGATWSHSRQVLIAEGGYQREEVRLSEEDAAILNDPSIVQGENAYIQQMMSGFTTPRRWDGLFMLPVAGVMVSGFGTVRSYNGGGFRSFHSGADLAAPVGTPIVAPADGVVVDTGLLDVRGYATIIDHGWGVYTGYWHQSRILVEPGDTVTAGQQIGAVGSTGLSTAAHLHWEMWVAGVPVDPMQWVRTAFP